MYRCDAKMSEPVKIALCLLLFVEFVFSQRNPVEEELRRKLACVQYEACGACLAAAAHCRWCADPFFRPQPSVPRCNDEKSLVEANCSQFWIQRPAPATYEVTEDRALQDRWPANTTAAVQIQPQKIRLTLRPKESHLVNFTYRPARNYPLDLYYLMDLTWSMKDDKETLVSLRDDLPIMLKNLTDNFRLGFGSFADKPLLPYMSVAPHRRANPCSGEDHVCEPTYSFRHHLSLTDEVHEFIAHVNSSSVTANLDNAEAGLDALLQALLCRRQLAWDDASRKIIIVLTDGLLHFAGDGKLGGAVERNDEECHLDENGYYSAATQFDYPSLAQIYRLLDTYKVNVIFAVTENVKSHYDNLHKLFEEYTYIGKLEADSSNILKLVKKGYEEIVSIVHFEDNAGAGPVKLLYFTDCGVENGPMLETARCTDVEFGKAYKFDVRLTLESCPQFIKGQKQTITIRDSQLGQDSLVLEVELQCGCECEGNEDDGHGTCPDHSHMVCGICQCLGDWSGPSCDCHVSDEAASAALEAKCREPNSTRAIACSGAGDCLCGACTCDAGRSGKYCECEPCPRSFGHECGGAGRGACACGECVCEAGWSRESCDCPASTDMCLAPGDTEPCSGRGDCRCGKCECSVRDGVRYAGAFCETCATCSNAVCARAEPCVNCTLYGGCGAHCDGYNVTLSYNTSAIGGGEEGALQWCMLRAEEDGLECEYAYTYVPLGTRNITIDVRSREGAQLRSAVIMLLYRVSATGGGEEGGLQWCMLRAEEDGLECEYAYTYVPLGTRNITIDVRSREGAQLRSAVIMLLYRVSATGGGEEGGLQWCMLRAEEDGLECEYAYTYVPLGTRNITVDVRSREGAQLRSAVIMLLYRVSATGGGEEGGLQWCMLRAEEDGLECEYAYTYVPLGTRNITIDVRSREGAQLRSAVIMLLYRVSATGGGEEGGLQWCMLRAEEDGLECEYAYTYVPLGTRNITVDVRSREGAQLRSAVIMLLYRVSATGGGEEGGLQWCMLRAEEDGLECEYAYTYVPLGTRNITIDVRSREGAQLRSAVIMLLYRVSATGGGEEGGLQWCMLRAEEDGLECEYAYTYVPLGTRNITVDVRSREGAQLRSAVIMLLYRVSATGGGEEGGLQWCMLRAEEDGLECEYAYTYVPLGTRNITIDVRSREGAQLRSAVIMLLYRVSATGGGEEGGLQWCMLRAEEDGLECEYAYTYVPLGTRNITVDVRSREGAQLRSAVIMLLYRVSATGGGEEGGLQWCMLRAEEDGLECEYAYTYVPLGTRNITVDVRSREGAQLRSAVIMLLYRVSATGGGEKGGLQWCMLRAEEDGLECEYAYTYVPLGTRNITVDVRSREGAQLRSAVIMLLYRVSATGGGEEGALQWCMLRAEEDGLECEYAYTYVPLGTRNITVDVRSREGAQLRSAVIMLLYRVSATGGGEEGGLQWCMLRAEEDGLECEYAYTYVPLGTRNITVDVRSREGAQLRSAVIMLLYRVSATGGGEEGGLQWCMLRAEEDGLECEYAYTYVPLGTRNITVDVRSRECAQLRSAMIMTSGLIIMTCVIAAGLIVIMFVKSAHVVSDRRAYAKFRAETELSMLAMSNQNPLYISPISEFRLPDSFPRDDTH